MISERRVGFAIVAAGALFVMVSTLTPVPHALPPHFESGCYACGVTGGVDVFLNLLLFMPLGFGLGLARRRWWVALAVCAGLSAFVETMQLLVVSGRDSSLSDWTNNTAGGFAAFLFAAHWRAVALPPARRAVALAAAWGAAAVAVFVVTGLGLRPDVAGPVTARLRGSGPQFLYYPGAVLGAVLSGTTVRPRGPDSLWMPTPGVEMTVTPATPLTASVLATAGPATMDVGPIAGTFVGSSPRTIIADDRGYLFWAVRLRTLRLKLRHPGVTIPRVFPAADGKTPGWLARGDTVRITGALAGDTLRLMAESHGRRIARALILSPYLGWTTILFWNLYAGDALMALLTALWVAGLIAPAAYWGEWAARAGRPLARGIAPVAAVLGAAAVPPALGATAAPWWVWAGLAAGVGGGAVLARWVGRSSAPVSG